jgi:hypothetical protein
VASRKTRKPRWALSTSTGFSGVAVIPNAIRCHLTMPITGYVVSETTICIDWAATRPGATNAR